MALSNYTDLKANIADYLARTDLTSVIPTFISLAETRLGRDVRLMEMLTQQNIAVTNAVATMPSNFLQLREIHFEGNPNITLEYQAPDLFYRNMLQNSANEPYYYTFIDNTIVFAPTGTPANVSMLYFAQPTALSDSNLTNAFTSVCMDALLYASLAEASIYLMDDARLQTWSPLYDRAIASIYRNNLGKVQPYTELAVTAR
jgi:hypothetical protein